MLEQELSALVLHPPQQELSWTRVGMGRKGTNPAPCVWIYPCVDLPSAETPPGAQLHALSRLSPRVLTSIAPVPAPVATDKSLQIDGQTCPFSSSMQVKRHNRDPALEIHIWGK